MVSIFGAGAGTQRHCSGSGGGSGGGPGPACMRPELSEVENRKILPSLPSFKEVLKM